MKYKTLTHCSEWMTPVIINDRLDSWLCRSCNYSEDATARDIAVWVNAKWALRAVQEVR